MKKTFAFLFAVVLCLALCACGVPVGEVTANSTPKNDEYAEKTLAILFGKITVTGDAYVPRQDGTAEKITGEIADVRVTKDRQHMVVLEEDGKLYVLVGAEKTQICDDCNSIKYINNNCFLYDSEETLEVPSELDPNKPEEVTKSVKYLYIFETKETYKLGNTDSYAMATETAAVLFSIQNEETEKFELRVFRPGDTSANTVLTSSNVLEAEGIADDCETYVWAEKGEKEDILYIRANGERERVISLSSNKYAIYDVDFNESSDAATFSWNASNDDNNTIGLWTAEEGVHTVKMPTMCSLQKYSALGKTNINRNFSCDTVYVTTLDSGTMAFSNLYAVNIEGERERLANGVKAVEIRNGYLYYINFDGALYRAKLGGMSIQDEKKIADGVCGMTVAPDGKTVAYVRDVASDNIGALYYCSENMDHPSRIEAESFCTATYNSYSKTWDYDFNAAFSNDGKALYYFTSGSEVESSGIYSATLKQYDIAKGESIRISSDVLPQLGSEYVGNYLGSSDIWYFKLVTNDKDMGIIADLLFWDGENTTVLANEIIY